MSIGNGLNFSTAAALAGIDPSSWLLGGSRNAPDTTTGSGINSLTNSRYQYTPTAQYTPTYNYTPPKTYTPTYNYTPTTTYTPRNNSLNQVTGNGFGSSTSRYFNPSNTIHNNTSSQGQNSFKLPATRTATSTNTNTNTNTPSNTDNSTSARDEGGSLPPVDKAALDVS